MRTPEIPSTKHQGNILLKGLRDALNQALIMQRSVSLSWVMDEKSSIGCLCLNYCVVNLEILREVRLESHFGASSAFILGDKYDLKILKRVLNFEK